MLPDCKIRNFTSDWNSGIALAALLDYCRPGLFPDWQRLRPENGNLNLHQWFQNIFNPSPSHFVCWWSQQVILCEAISPFCSNNFLSWRNNIYIFASNAFLTRNLLASPNRWRHSSAHQMRQGWPQLSFQVWRTANVRWTLPNGSSRFLRCLHLSKFQIELSIELVGYWLNCLAIDRTGWLSIN